MVSLILIGINSTGNCDIIVVVVDSKMLSEQPVEEIPPLSPRANSVDVPDQLN